MGETAIGLYTDPETGRLITTHSMVKTFRRCPKQTQYKYVERLKPRILGRPLRLGTWMHALQEVHCMGGDWREKHEEMRKRVWAPLFDEEKEDIGDLPGDAYRLMQSYLWHYANDPWKYHEVEFVLEAELPDGSIYRGKIDALVENYLGLWVVDNKWFKKGLPDVNFRILDAQGALYVWAALKNKIPVQGFIWNVGVSKPPTYPAVLKTTGGPARWASCDTDYPTMVRWFKENMDGKLPAQYKPKMEYLKSLQYVPGGMQPSSHFRRSVLDKSPRMLKQVAQEAFHTHKRMHSYPFDRSDVERVADRSCSFMCNYTDLCTAELFTGERPLNWQQRYTVGDPMDYYFDDPTPTKEEA